MQTTFPTLPSCKIIFISFFLSVPHLLISAESLETAQQNVALAQEKVTKRLETKLNQKQTELELCITAVKAEPLYSRLEKALQDLRKEPAHEFYRLNREMHDFIKELENYNKVIIRPELLTKINTLLEQLKNYDTFTSLRSTLKKQRVALLELFEEKDLILSVEKILKYQNKELAELLAEQQKIVTALPTYQHVQELQTSYLETKTVKKLLLCIEKKRELILQQKSALLKSKEYQKALDTYERLIFFQDPSAHHQEPGALTKKELLRLQHELFIAPLENIL